MQHMPCSLYGLIEVPPLCNLFLQTPEYKRMENIRQLGKASNVYPGATHSVKEHSMGIMHLAHQMCDTIGIKNTRMIELVMLAGLSKNVGCCSVSNITEHLLIEAGIFRPCHIRSEETLKSVNHQLGMPLTVREVEIVRGMMIGERPTNCFWLPALFSIVCDPNSGFDVSKMDSLMRDSQKTGFTITPVSNIIQKARIQKGCLVYHSSAFIDICKFFEKHSQIMHYVYLHPCILKHHNDTAFIIKQCLNLPYLFAAGSMQWLQMTDSYIYVLNAPSKVPSNTQTQTYLADIVLNLVSNVSFQT
jgi:HD superfamily phosphohydrolase